VNKSTQNKELQSDFNEAKQELQVYGDTRARTQVAPSFDRMNTADTHANGTRHPSSSRKIKSDSDFVAGRENNKIFKITVRSKENDTPETIKKLIKTKIYPTQIKVGVSTFKDLKDGRILIEVGTKEEIDRIRTSIAEKCGKELEAKAQDLRNPRLVIYTIPEDITIDNATQTI
jgi:hypothetical protein